VMRALSTNHRQEIPNHGKISPAFSARQAWLKPNQKLHAVVMLRTLESLGRYGKRPTPEQRQAAIDEIRSSAPQALRDIDSILSRFEGRRLSDKPTALGTIAIESTAAGIGALAASD